MKSLMHVIHVYGIFRFLTHTFHHLQIQVIIKQTKIQVKHKNIKSREGRYVSVRYMHIMNKTNQIEMWKYIKMIWN